MSETEAKIATKKKALIDCRVTADLSASTRWVICRNGETRVEAEARALESRAKEFNEFIRDHRSQDDIRLDVERIYEDRCSECDHEWEVLPASDDGPECCAYCGTPTAAPTKGQQ